MKFSQQPVAALFVSAALVVSVAAQDSEQIPDVPQTVTGVNIHPKCVGGTHIPTTMFTIEPADFVTVTASPPNLVTVEEVSGSLTFAYDAVVADSAKSGGVLITMPADQLNSLAVGDAQPVQVLGGFTSVTSVQVSGASTAHLDLSSNTAELSLDVSGASTANIKSETSVGSGRISGASTLTIAAPSIASLDLSGASNIRLDGDINGGSVSGASVATISGSITGAVSNSGASTINAGSCGTMTTNSGASTCNEGPQVVMVSVFEQATTSQGFRVCWDYSSPTPSVPWPSPTPDSASSSVDSYPAGILAAATAAAAVGFAI